MIDLSGLNPEQRHAAETIKGPVLILAGAGSGKTRTITYRIAHMISNLRIPASEILAVSFTNKAATEMHERVTKLLGPRKKRALTLSTFHSLGIKILREDIHELGYSKKFTIYDQADQMAIIREALKNFHMEKAAFDKKTIASKIGFLKNSGIGPNEFKDTEHFDEDNDYDIAAEYCYHYYQEKLQFYNAVDFDDILFLVVRLFEKCPHIARKYSQKYKYIMVDEYQDTNGLQVEMIAGLTSTHSNLCVVGDDDQSIYAFRGADIANILNFSKKYENTLIIKLEQNYRSTAKILDLANTIIKDNKVRMDKKMRSENHTGSKPYLWSCANGDHEAQVVIDEIIKIQAQGRFLGEVAIVYRSKTQISPFEDQVRLANIPYNIVGGQKFYEKKEIKDLIAYLSVIFNPKDEIALRRILNVPHRGVGNVTLNNFLDLAKKSGATLFEIIELESYKDDSKKSKNLQDFVALIKQYNTFFTTMTLTQALASLIQEIEYNHFIEKSYDSPKISARKKNDVKNFLLSTDRFVDKFTDDATLGSYLERLLLADNQDNQEDDGLPKNEVQFMTMHSSKGLEFESVFLVGMEEELLPHKNVIQEGGNVDEERRLCYVGITRAKSQLFMTYAQMRKIYGREVKRHKSRFLIEHEHAFNEQDRNTFGHMSEEEEEKYKSNFFNDLLSSLDD